MGRGRSLVLAWVGAVLLATSTQICRAGETTRVSVDSGGVQGNNASLYPSISADGRLVAFASYASLVPDDTNGDVDVFVHDRQTRKTSRVSVDSDGIQGNGSGTSPSISADGRFVAFNGFASNLVPDDTNGVGDVFVHDRQTRSIVRVSIDSNGVQGNLNSFGSSLSADGRFVAFASYASNLVPDDTNFEADVFVHDLQTRNTSRVSVDSDGIEANHYSFDASISADGRFVAFASWASNLVPDDSNQSQDVFVHDRLTRITTRVSVGPNGIQANGSSRSPSLSADGRFVAFHSNASDLVPDDENGRSDVFVFDRQTTNTQRISVASNGLEANHDSYLFSVRSVSADGRYVSFISYASNLVPDDTNNEVDVFVHDFQTRSTSRVSVSSEEVQGNDYSGEQSISADGRLVAFMSPASNLVHDDTNFTYDIFVHDRLASQPPASARVHLSLALDPPQRILSILCRAYDNAAGRPLRQGAGSFVLSDEASRTLASGTMLYQASPDAWVATLDLGPLSLPNGRYSVDVRIVSFTGSAGEASGIFFLSPGSGAVEGLVTSFDGVPLAGATVDLFDALGQLRGDPAIASMMTGAGGTFRFDPVQTGSYVLTASADGFGSTRSSWFPLVGGATHQEYFALLSDTESRPLRRLSRWMDRLAGEVRLSIERETDRLIELSNRVRDDISSGGAIDVAAKGAIDFALDTLDDDQTLHALSDAVADRPLDISPALSTSIGLRTLTNAGFQIGWAALQLFYESRLLALIEGRAIDDPRGEMVYSDALSTLAGEETRFADLARTTESVDPAFSFAKAEELLRSQVVQTHRARREDFAIVKPKASAAYLDYLSPELPSRVNAYLDVLECGRQLGAVESLTFGIKIAAVGVGVASAVVLGPAGAPISAAAFAVGTTVGRISGVTGVVQMAQKAVLTISYFYAMQGWAQDVAGLPGVYRSALDFVALEASEARYLRDDRSFSADVSVDINPDFRILGRRFVLLDGLPLPGVVRENRATIRVQNTSSESAEFRVKVESWHEEQAGCLFASSQVLLKRTSFDFESRELAPGEMQDFELSYAGANTDPVWIFEPRWLTVEVYAGPFLVHVTPKIEFYLICPTIYCGGSRVGIVGDDPALLPDVRLLASATLTPTSPTMEVDVPIPETTRSVSFELHPEGSAALALGVIDSQGRYVGDDPRSGEIAIEFPAVTSPPGNRPMVVSIPDAMGQSFRARVSLVGADSTTPAAFSLYQVSRAVLPATMAVVPTPVELEATLAQDQVVRIGIAEVGQLQPLRDVSVLMGPITGPTDRTLVPMSSTEVSFETIPAGAQAETSFRLHVPGNVPFGDYSGTALVTTANAGELSVPVTVRVIENVLTCRVGNVNYGGADTEDVLFVNDSPGNALRVVPVAVRQPIDLRMDEPSSRAGRGAKFALYVWPGEPDDTTRQTQPFGLGTTCMPTPLGGGGTSAPIKILNNIGRVDRLGAPSFPSTPAPFSRRIPQGLSRPIRLTLQGFIQDDASQSRAGASITNAVLLRVE